MPSGACPPMKPVPVVVYLLVAVLAGCGEKGTALTGIHSNPPKTMSSACSYQQSPSRVTVRRSGSSPLATTINNPVLAQQLLAAVCGLSPAQSTTQPRPSAALYHLNFWMQGQSVAKVVAEVAPPHQAFYDSDFATGYQTKQQFWSLLARGLDVPQSQLFPR